MWLTDVQTYEALRDRCHSQDAESRSYATRLRRRAEHFCRAPTPGVTDKEFTEHSPTRNPHDYVSIATYWWPNPDTSDGLPYQRRDGEVSPDFHLYDRPRWDRAVDGMVTLIKAAYFLDQPKFARAAAKRVRRWFCDPETRMTPHLCYSQMIPGRRTGCSVGLIDFSLYLPVLLDHTPLLAQFDGTEWSSADHQAMARWCEEFFAWLESHRFSREVEERKNNHAVYYDRLVVCMALFLDKPDRARSQLQKSRQRIGQQIQPDGSMPAELRRTCSFGYTVMNLRGFLDLAWIGRRLDVPLWSGNGEEGEGTIADAVDFLCRHACSKKPWPYPQIEPIHWSMIWPVLHKANLFSDRKYEYARVTHRVPPDFVPDLFTLVEPIHPFGESRSPD